MHVYDYCPVFFFPLQKMTRNLRPIYTTYRYHLIRIIRLKSEADSIKKKKKRTLPWRENRNLHMQLVPPDFSRVCN